VACHFAEDIRDGRIAAHEVKPELVEADLVLNPDIEPPAAASVAL
jgi:peptide/nickel transport system ATP-binding protein